MSNKTGAGDKPTPEDLLGASLEAEIEAVDLADRFKDRIDPNHPVLTVEDQIAALQKAELAVAAERRKSALKDFQAKEEQRLKGAVGQTTGDPVKDELVHITLDLAEHQPHISLGMGETARHFHHGQTYKVPRHVADTLREAQQRGWNHQLEIEGKGLSERFRRPQAVVLSGRGVV